MVRADFLIKSFLFILLLFAGTHCRSQAPSTFPACSNSVTGNVLKKGGSATVHNLVGSLRHDTCLTKKFSVVFYVIADSANPGNWVSATDISNCINTLNSVFSRICVEFLSCSTHVIQNYTFNRWKSATTESMVVNNFNTDNTINIYLSNSVTPQPSYTYPPGSNPKNIIVYQKNVLTDPALVSFILHEMGHFFGLPHTDDETGTATTPAPPPGIKSYEFVDRTNCHANGDGFCDTEADPYPVVNAKDGKGQYYLIPKDNFMSNYTDRCRFTQEQYNFMARLIVKQMLFLN